MTKLLRRILGLALCAVLLSGILPLTAHASRDRVSIHTYSELTEYLNGHRSDLDGCLEPDNENFGWPEGDVTLDLTESLVLVSDWVIPAGKTLRLNYDPQGNFGSGGWADLKPEDPKASHTLIVEGSLTASDSNARTNHIIPSFNVTVRSGGRVYVAPSSNLQFTVPYDLNGAGLNPIWTVEAGGTIDCFLWLQGELRGEGGTVSGRLRPDPYVLDGVARNPSVLSGDLNITGQLYIGSFREDVPAILTIPEGSRITFTDNGLLWLTEHQVYAYRDGDEVVSGEETGRAQLLLNGELEICSSSGTARAGRGISSGTITLGEQGKLILNAGTYLNGEEFATVPADVIDGYGFYDTNEWTSEKEKAWNETHKTFPGTIDGTGTIVAHDDFMRNPSRLNGLVFYEYMSDREAEFREKAQVGKDVRITGDWVERGVSYMDTVVLDPMGGTLEESYLTRQDDGSFPVSLPVPTASDNMEGQYFCGWYSIPISGGELAVTGADLKGGSTLFARWSDQPSGIADVTGKDGVISAQYFDYSGGQVCFASYGPDGKLLDVQLRAARQGVSQDTAPFPGEAKTVKVFLLGAENGAAPGSPLCACGVWEKEQDK